MKLQIRLVVLAGILAMALFSAAAVMAAPPSSFSGVWEADDNVDGSHLRLTVSGGGNGTYRLRWLDDYWSLCSGGPGRGSGTASLSGGTLSGTIAFYCGSSLVLEAPVTFTLNGDDTMTDSVQGATWSPVGSP